MMQAVSRRCLSPAMFYNDENSPVLSLAGSIRFCYCIPCSMTAFHSMVETMFYYATSSSYALVSIL